MTELLGLAMDIGEQMLLCGAEVHRVEDSVDRMCHMLGAKRVDVFIITSSMVVTVYSEEGKCYTQTRRITGSGTNLEKLHHLNQLSRNICQKHMTAEEIRMAFEKIQTIKTYPFWLVCLSYALIAAAFTLFFGGNMGDAVISALIGVCISFVVLFAEKLTLNRIFEKFISSFMVTALAYLFLKLGAIANVDKVIIGNIMVLIPGIGLTNALRDLFTGDSIAGLLRSVECILIALAIGAGYFLFAWMIGGSLL